MRQIKFTSWFVAFFVVICVMFASSHAMADFTTCTARQGNGSSATITAVTSGGFPLNFADNNADTQNYCGNSNPDNYPCSVFKYFFETFDGPSSSDKFNSTHLWATIPVCPDEQLNILGNSVNFPPNSTSNAILNDFGEKYDWNYRRIIIPSGGGSGSSSHAFHIAVKIPPGKEVGVGVNDIVSYSNSAGLFACKSENTSPSGTYSSGILGPSCYTVKTICQPSTFSARTTNICLSNVNGQVVNLGVENKKIQAVYFCPTGDKSCASTACDPNDPNDPNMPNCTMNNGFCVKKKTFEVEVGFYDGDVPITGSDGSPLKLQVRDIGGAVEESIGYLVVSDGDPTIYCITGVGGNTICVCSGSPGKCPQ